MSPEDSGHPPDPAQPPRPRRDSEAAFAATVAPAPTREPAVAAVGTQGPGAVPTGASQLPTRKLDPGDAATPPRLVLPIVESTHYKSDREIARGGMGRIVAADDQRLGRRVAIKELLEPAGDQLGRFQREALITARLQHHGIVPVYEAGRWPTGEPFFAMKLVAGRPLDRVIADARTYEERLILLPRIAAAADAIAYAHSQRVVHRDLKPGNILIGDFGETVVIDWGLAKDLDAGDGPDSVRPSTSCSPQMPAERDAAPNVKRATTTSGSSTLTVAGAVMGTPAYMAPEQARGEPVDTRADVFALGAMLYHVLAGVPPYNARTATDVIAAAALGKVVPLRERERRAPRDLVAIVERAMEPLPIDRYPDAGELADELRRFLTGQLVSAHRYTQLQKVKRFVKKHRAAVTIATLAAIGFAVGGTIAVQRVVAERDAAERASAVAVARREAAETLIDNMLNDQRARLEAIGRIDLLSHLGEDVRDYYNRLDKMPGGMLYDDIDRMARAIDLIGLAERNSGQADRALQTWTQARALLGKAIGNHVSMATRGKRMMIARFDYQIGTIHQQRGKSTAAIASFEKAKAGFATLRNEAPSERLLLLWSAENHDRLGDMLRNNAKIDAALEEYSAAKLQREQASTHASSRPSEEVRALSTSHLKVGTIYQARGESATAMAAYKTALRLRETVLEDQPDNTVVQEEVLQVQDHIAELQRMVGDTKSAIETYHQALPIIEALTRRDPSNTQWKRQRGNLLADVGFAMLDSGNFQGGLVQLESAIDAQKDLISRDPKNAQWAIDLSRSCMRAGDGHLYLGAIDDGIHKYELSLGIRRDLMKRDAASAAYRRATAWSLHKLANAYTHKSDLARAIETHEQVLALRSKLVAESATQSGYKNELASTEVTFARLLARPDPARAKELVAAGLARARELVAADALSNEWKETLTQGLIAQAEVARATGDVATRRAAIDEGIEIANAGKLRAPQNPQWPGFLAELHLGRAELAAAAGDRATMRAAYKAIVDELEPLAKADSLPATRKPLLERARNFR